eukprot:TRINITY_DN489_c0_g4_i1.p1 TRINITY_DN489_c0_g4~~TRINITY_DN489_c0_g4_i1.p1  ORF type:complete len:1045 (+),score=407.62 TRINITY_DN489_c0_g4_i1:151-3285(+)
MQQRGSSPPGGHSDTYRTSPGSPLGRTSGSPQKGTGGRRSSVQFDQTYGALGNTSATMSGTQKKPVSGPSADATSTNVRVMVRVRPFSSSEIALVKQTPGAYLQSVIDMPRADQVQVLDHEKNYTPMKAFNFDTVLWSVLPEQQKSPCGFADQERVYWETGAIALDAAWEGMNSCIFAYGQTGSGKTHTMMGDPSQIAGGDGCADDQLGVIPRLCRQLYIEMEDRQEHASRVGIRKSVELECTFIEIYNERVTDLLVGAPGTHYVRDGTRFKAKDTEATKGTYQAPTDAANLFRRDSGRKKEDDKLQVREHPTEGPQIAGVTVYQPSSYRDIISLINFGNQARSVAETKMNDRSSRSHAMFRIQLRQISYLEVERAGIGGPKVETSERFANINLVDLAGSENTKRSGARGTTMVEAQKINLSLTTLRRCIDALIDKKPSATIPYRDSTLTWLLRQNLGGNSRCFMLATVSPHYSNAHESIRTLEYAMRARSIVNNVRVNEDDTAKMLRDLEKRLEEKQKALLEECASTEERSELMKELQEAQQYKEELQGRIDEMNRQWEQQQRNIQEVRAQKTVDFFRHARAFAEQRKQLSAVSKEAERQERELTHFRGAAESAGHTDFDAMADSLITNRQEVERLLQEAAEMKRKQEELQEKERQLAAQQEKERAELHAQIEKLLSQQREEQMKGDATLAEARQREEDKAHQISGLYETKLAEATRRHEQELQAAREESEELISRLEQEEEAKLSKNTAQMQRQLDVCRQELRAERERSAARMRAVQDAEMRLRAQLDEARNEREKADQELAVMRNSSQGFAASLTAKISEEQEEAQRLVEAIRDCEENMRLDQAQGEAEAEDMRVQAQVAQDEAERDSMELERVKAALRKRQEACEKPCERAREILELIETGELPKHWSIVDFRAMVDQLHACRRAVVASKSFTPAAPGGELRPPALSVPAAMGAGDNAGDFDGYTKADQVPMAAAPSRPKGGHASPPRHHTAPITAKGSSKRRAGSARPSTARGAVRAPRSARVSGGPSTGRRGSSSKKE